MWTKIGKKEKQREEAGQATRATKLPEVARKPRPGSGLCKKCPLKGSLNQNNGSRTEEPVGHENTKGVIRRRDRPGVRLEAAKDQDAPRPWGRGRTSGLGGAKEGKWASTSEGNGTQSCIKL